ncbi:MAG TPA: FGGY family carbohydrate kinase [Phycisphaerae bacterium]|nr:FGGY family carbohydrate kinase [Phycisphaerae bacterium]
MPDLLLGIDVGTSAVKSGIFDLDGRLLGIARSPYRTSAPHPGWAECDPELWWRGFVKSLDAACDKAGVKAGRIGAVGVDVLYPAVMPLDAAGRALHPAILYCDQRSILQVKAIEAKIPREEYQSIIGNTLVPGNCAVTSLLWLRDERPKEFTSARTIGFASTFVTSRLTGEFFADPSMAALSGLVDIRDPWLWSDNLCGILGIDAARLPRIAGAAEVIGTVTEAAAKATGLKPGTPVVCGCGDAPACALGAGALSPGTVVYIAGSTDCVAVPMRSATQDRRWVNSAYIPRGVWMGIGTTTSSGMSVEWFVREILGSGKEAIQQMTALAASSPPGSRRVLYLPYLQGERTPVWDPMARGMFIGLTSTTTLADMARAVFEGTAFALRQVIECLRNVLREEVGEIMAVGGATANDLWNTIKASALKRRLHVLSFQETGALGAALLAGIGAGHYKSFEDALAVARSVGGGRIVEPDQQAAAVYDELFPVYSSLYPRTRDIAHALACKRPEEGTTASKEQRQP